MTGGSRAPVLLAGALVVLTLLGAWGAAQGSAWRGLETVVIAAALVLLILRAFTLPIPLDSGRGAGGKKTEPRLGCTECGARLQATRRTDGVSVWTCFTCGAEAPVAATRGVQAV